MSLAAAVGQTVVTSLVGLVVTLLARRALRRRQDVLEHRLEALEQGVTIIVREGARMSLRQYRKAVAAGSGGLLGGLLIYVESNDLDPVLGPLVPEQYRPLVAWLVGAVVIVLSVIHATNDPKPAPIVSESPVTLDEPAPPVVPAREQGGGSEPAGTAPAAAADATPPVDATTAAAVPERGAWWAGVQGGAPTSPTALVRLQPPPERSPM